MPCKSCLESFPKNPSIMFSQDPCFGVKEKITRIVETNKIVPRINSTWALPIKIVNAKKLLQVFAIFLNAFSILIGSGYSWFRCRFIAFGNAGAPLLSLARLRAMGFNLLDCPFIVAGTGTYKIGT